MRIRIQKISSKYKETIKRCTLLKMGSCSSTIVRLLFQLGLLVFRFRHCAAVEHSCWLLLWKARLPIYTYLLSECLKAVDEPGPEVSEQGSINPLQALLGAGIHTHIQLRHWDKAPAWARG